ncbi:hypothetical protein phiCP51_0046 [Clostridium phage vB_CpeS-CP51]|nr:hypothetical protein phiCP51_0046 [Clostridium phage vB_CpeS-CP51]AGH27937.1 hypothetical protein phiCP51_0046 [Clostridium phage vB_CpeS-CP51]
MESYSSWLRGQIANLLVGFMSSKSSNLLLSAIKFNIPHRRGLH